MSTGHTITASKRAEIVERLSEAFNELSNCGGDAKKMAEAIGGARYLVAAALSKLGSPEAMRAIDAGLKAFHESLSNSAATLPNAAKESVPAADPLGGGNGDALAFILDASAPEFEALFAAAITSQETY